MLWDAAVSTISSHPERLLPPRTQGKAASPPAQPIPPQLALGDFPDSP